MKAKAARALNVTRPPVPGREGWVHVSVALRPWEYERLLSIADTHGLVEADVLRAALWLLLRDKAKQTGFYGSEKR